MKLHVVIKADMHSTMTFVHTHCARTSHKEEKMRSVFPHVHVCNTCTLYCGINPKAQGPQKAMIFKINSMPEQKSSRANLPAQLKKRLNRSIKS